MDIQGLMKRIRKNNWYLAQNWPASQVWANTTFMRRNESLGQRMKQTPAEIIIFRIIECMRWIFSINHILANWMSEEHLQGVILDLLWRYHVCFVVNLRESSLTEHGTTWHHAMKSHQDLNKTTNNFLLFPKKYEKFFWIADDLSMRSAVRCGCRWKSSNTILWAWKTKEMIEICMDWDVQMELTYKSVEV